MGQNPAGILHQMIKQTVLSWSQLDQFAFNPNFMPAKVDRQAVIDHDLPAFLILAEVSASQNRTDPAGQLSGG